MTKTEEFRQYAAEAIRWAHQSKTEQDGLALLEIAQTWLRAAAFRENVLYVNADHAVPDAGPRDPILSRGPRGLFIIIAARTRLRQANGSPNSRSEACAL